MSHFNNYHDCDEYYDEYDHYDDESRYNSEQREYDNRYYRIKRNRPPLRQLNPPRYRAPRRPSNRREGYEVAPRYERSSERARERDRDRSRDRKRERERERDRDRSRDRNTQCKDNGEIEPQKNAQTGNSQATTNNTVQGIKRSAGDTTSCEQKTSDNNKNEVYNMSSGNVVMWKTT
eukprot:430150_1